MKLEIESDKVDSPDEFRARKHIQMCIYQNSGESFGGSPAFS